MPKAKETDFFKQMNILFTKRHKEKLDDLKKHTTLSNNIDVDNSTFVRAMVDYLHEHPEVCSNIKRYIIQNKGATYLTNFEVMVSEEKSIEQIADGLGVDVDIIKKIYQK